MVQGVKRNLQRKTSFLTIWHPLKTPIGALNERNDTPISWRKRRLQFSFRNDVRLKDVQNGEKMLSLVPGANAFTTVENTTNSKIGLDTKLSARLSVNLILSCNQNPSLHQRKSKSIHWDVSLYLSQRQVQSALFVILLHQRLTLPTHNAAIYLYAIILMSTRSCPTRETFVIGPILCILRALRTTKKITAGIGENVQSAIA